MHTVSAIAPAPASRHYSLRRVFYGAILLQIIALLILFMGGPWGLHVSLFLQAILCWSVVVILHVDVRLRFESGDSEELDCNGECCKSERALCFYHHLLAHLRHEKTVNDRRGGSTSVLQFHVADTDESSQDQSRSPRKRDLPALAALVRETIIQGRVVVGKVGARDLVALLPYTDCEDATDIAGRLRQKLPAWQGGEGVESVSVSVTTATYPQDGETVDEVLAAANRPFVESKGSEDRGQKSRSVVSSRHDRAG